MVSIASCVSDILCARAGYSFKAMMLGVILVTENETALFAQATTKEGLDAVSAQLKGYTKGVEVGHYPLTLHILF